MTTTTKLPGEPRCPNCQALLDGASNLESGHRPQPDDLTICAYCASYMVFTEGFGLREAFATTHSNQGEQNV